MQKIWFVGEREEMAASDVEYRCFVGGLAWATDDHSLNNAFSTEIGTEVNCCSGQG